MYRNVVVLAARAVHRARELAGVGHHVVVQETEMSHGFDALEHRGDRARERVVARRGALRADAVHARVKALAEDRAAFGLARRRVVQDELLEDVRRAVRPVQPGPLLSNAGGAGSRIVYICGGRDRCAWCAGIRD